MSILDRIFRKQAAPATPMQGRTMVRSPLPLGWIDRSAVLSADRLAANRSVPTVLESLRGMSMFCYGGLDHVLKPIDSSDDTQGANIEKALAQIRLQEKRIGRVGKSRKVGTIGLIRASAMDGWTFSKALTEFGAMQEGNWLNFSEIQILPAQSFGTASPLAGNDYLADKILPGIVFDQKQDLTRFFQYSGSGMAKELEGEGIIYIEDTTLPDGISILSSLNPTIEAWKEVRRYGMTAEKRVAVPNETERIDANDLVKMITAKIPVKIQDLIDHCDDLAENQSYANRKVAIAGTRIEYPAISMPLNPWEADKYLKEEIISFFFLKDVLEQLGQAISVSSAPAKEIIDMIVSTEREIWGNPYQNLWNTWLQDWNGFELHDTLEFWSWTPEDKKAEHAKNLENFRSHSMTLNEYRRAEGMSDLTDEEITALAAEHALIFGNKNNAMNPSNTTV